jgi:hypothetical protein
MTTAAPASAHDDRRERMVGDYVLGRRLGSGAMGDVWLGFHRDSNAPAAIKLIIEREGLRGRTKRLLDREWRAVARLHHPNVVALYDEHHVVAAREHIRIDGRRWLRIATWDGSASRPSCLRVCRVGR